MGGSAISQLNTTYSLNTQNCIQVQREKNRTTWKNKSTSQQLEEYQFVVNDSSQFRAYIDIFQFRYRSDALVSSKYLNIQQQNGICTNVVRGSVFIQKIPIRLSDINQIPFPDILHFYAQCFRGFGDLFLKYGYFEITEDLIGSNQSGKVKVWMNSNLNLTKKDINYIKPQGTEIQMMEKVMQLLDLNTNQQQSESLYLFINSKSPQSFKEAYHLLQQYSRLHKVSIPSFSNCLLSMTNILKDNPIEVLTFKNPFTELSSSSGVENIRREIVSHGSEVKYATTSISHFTLNPKLNSNIRSLTPPPTFIKPISYPQNMQIQKNVQHIVPKIVQQKNSINTPNRNYYVGQIPVQYKQKVSQEPLLKNIPKVQSHSISVQKNISLDKNLKQFSPGKFTPSTPVRMNHSPVPITNYSPSKQLDLKSNSSPIQSNIPKSNHQISQKRSPVTLKRKQETAFSFMPNSQYYSNFAESKITKQTTSSSSSSFTNKFSLYNTHNKSSQKQPNTSVFKQPSTSWTPVQRINRFATPQNSKNMGNITAPEMPKQQIVFVNQKQKSSFMVIPDSLTKIEINTIMEEHQSMKQYGDHAYYDKSDYSERNFNEEHLSDSNASIKPRFPNPEIVNIKQKQQVISQALFHQSVQKQQPRGEVYVKRKVPSLQYIHSIRSQSSIPIENVKVSCESNQFNFSNKVYNNNYNFNSYNDLNSLNALRLKETTESKEAVIETTLSHQNRDYHINNIDKVIESPVQFRITRQQYNTYQFQYPSTFSNLNNFKINTPQYSPNIYQGIVSESMYSDYKQLKEQISQDPKQDHIDYKIKINGQ